MYLTAAQRSLLERFVNVCETGTPEGRYGAISIYADGPHRIRQITYGRSQTTEYGNLRRLVRMYVAAGGLCSAALAPYADRVGSVALTDDQNFRALLQQAGRRDPVMRTIQDRFFDETYFQPAMTWAGDNGFTLPLSALVIYDSFVHSGGILWLLRQRFAENPPLLGGDERAWVGAYVRVRDDWLRHHANAILNKTVYRTQALMGTSRNRPCSPEPGLHLHKSSAGEQLMPAASCCPPVAAPRDGVLPLTRAVQTHLRS